MSGFRLQTKENRDSTLVSNIFLDYYMPTANGSYVKVYLYLLRCLGSCDMKLSIPFLADRLENTESDILRAFHYWEKVGLLELSKDSSGEIVNICLCNPEPLTASPTTSHSLPKSSTKRTDSTNNTIPPSQSTVNSNITPSSRNSAASYCKNYSPEQLDKLTQDKSLQNLLKVIESYMERPLKPGDIQLVVFLCQDLHFSDELVMYLFEYCISRGKHHCNYIEKVAIQWKEEGITTVEQAEQASNRYNRDFNAVSKAFGLGRMPAAMEQKFIQRWIREFAFDTPILVEACNRTILQIKKPDFNYADKILEKWHKSGVHTLSDINALDNTYKQSKQNRSNTPQTNNKFNSYPQRNYSAKDYSDLEKRLVEKNFHKD
ncbi:MAG: DnaD domain protein [Lachnospiraceae bacterium]|nr:DnaD domain protein [Lachnospiraceae bacterium]